MGLYDWDRMKAEEITDLYQRKLAIGESVTVTILDIKGSRVRIGVNAPRDVAVQREEIFQKTGTRPRMPESGP